MKAPRIFFVVLQFCFCFVSAETAIPDWSKYPIFFAGVALLASIAWFSLCCCCIPLGCMTKIVILLLVTGGMGTWGYFMLGPWWNDVNVKGVLSHF